MSLIVINVCHASIKHMQVVVDGHQAGKGNKTISEEFGLHHSTVRSGGQTEITPKAGHREPHGNVSRSTGLSFIGSIFTIQNAVYGWIARRKPPLFKNNIADLKIWWWMNQKAIGKRKIQLFSLNEKRCIW